MKNTPIEVVRTMYRKFSEGDLDAVLNLCADDVEWVVNGPVSTPQCKSYTGRDGVKAFFELLVANRAFTSFETRQFLCDGSTVIVLGDAEGTDLIDGSRIRSRWAHIIDVDNGRIARFREFLCEWHGTDTLPAMSW